MSDRDEIISLIKKEHNQIRTDRLIYLMANKGVGYAEVVRLLNSLVNEGVVVKASDFVSVRIEDEA